MQEKGTKEKLLEAAVELFSTKGYDATGVDEIAEAIGIKGPNLYKYYRGKAALLEEILTRFGPEYRERMGMTPKKPPVFTDGAGLKAFTLRQVDDTVNEPVLRKLRRIFQLEQFRDRTFSRRATEYQLTNMETMYTGIFEVMMERGCLKRGDAGLLALEYIAPVTLLIQLGDREPERIPECRKRIGEHLDLFLREHGVLSGTEASRPMFRKAKPEEAGRILTMYRSAVGGPFCTWDDEYPAKENLEEDLAADGLFVLERDGELIGAISAAPENELEEFPVWKIREKAAEFARVVICPELQGQGLSGALVDGILEELRKRGTVSVHIAVAKKNLPARKLYESRGFELRGEASMYGNEYELREKIL